MKNILPNMHFETCKTCLCATCLYRKDGICTYKNRNIEACNYCASMGYEVTEANCKYHKEKIINFEDHIKETIIDLDKLYKLNSFRYDLFKDEYIITIEIDGYDMQAHFKLSDDIPYILSIFDNSFKLENMTLVTNLINLIEFIRANVEVIHIHFSTRDNKLIITKKF